MIQAIRNQLNRSFTLGQCLSWWGLTLILIVLGAHFYRAGQYGLTLCSFGFLAFNSTHSAWKKYVVAFFLICGAMEWSRTVYNLILIRQQFGLPWLRGALILSIVASLTAFSGYFAYVRAGKMRKADDKPLFMAVVFTLTFMLLWLMTTNQGAANLLILERYYPVWGRVQIFFASWYAAYIAARLIDPKTSRRARKKAWLIFSCIFFGQLILGLIGWDKMLMTGKLHIPVPAFIALAPVYRGEISFFMPILLLFSIIFTGASWCSFLCYFGAFDALAATGAKKDKPLPKVLSSALKYGRPASLLIGVATAALLRLGGATWLTVTIAVTVFILASFLIMFTISKKYSSMVHCTAFCPIGLIVNLVGRISPWRVKVDTDLCNDCGACEKVCDYRAINRESRQQGKTNFRCSTCRDCLGRCATKAIYLSNPLIPNRFSELVFVATVTVLHVLFLCAARV